MELNQKEWEIETSRLKDVCDKITETIAEKNKSLDEYKEDVIEIRRSMWDNTAHVLSGEFDESVEILQYINLMIQEEKSHQHTSEQVKKLERMLETPYFARIDFVYDEFDDKEKIYIGMSSLIDNDTMDILIYDWRAPISSMFYEYELGDASFKVDKKSIKGKVELKRQYKIFHSKLVYMFDSSIKIDDEILQEILSKSADDKMKNIVISIQKEQNKIIRDEDTRVLIVQGAAGSGKTSIALHRIAYLLYRQKDEGLKSKNVAIFSPNQIFNDYISDVLPELGEENVHQTTFYEYARSCIIPEIKLESVHEQMDFMLSQNKDSHLYKLRKHSIDYKSSLEFLQVLENYLTLLNDHYEGFLDIRFNKALVISKEELEKLYNHDYKHFTPIKRLQKIRDRVNYLLRPLTGPRLKEIAKQIEEGEEKEFNIKQVSRALLHNELKDLRGKLEAMTEINTYKLFIRLFEDKKFFERLSGKLDNKAVIDLLEYTTEYLNNNRLYYEDIAPYLYFKGMLEGTLHIADIRHVVIDEAQDYSYLQYQIIKRLFKYASFTILGDVNQAINSYMRTADYHEASEIFADYGANIMTLNKSYRSTREIWQLSEHILSSCSNKQPINRSGEKPQLVHISKKNEMNQYAVKKLLELSAQGMKSIAVICKTAKQCEHVHSSIKKDLKMVNLITSESARLTAGICIIPCYLSKGLEFDAVIIYDASKDSYEG
ncbi:MAG TPA: RNA polymerase recycling motor HelD, partial [Patescibacteria group bacterium]|nr:RNA polymerase recycling motor HelD [Patescibacteria group bacterium]